MPIMARTSHGKSSVFNVAPEKSLDNVRPSRTQFEESVPKQFFEEAIYA